MNHERDDQIFEKYMDGELDPRAEAEFEEHVKNCPECAGRYAGMMKIKRGLSSIADEPLPVDFSSNWKKKIYSYKSPPGRSTARYSRYIPAIAAGVAAIAVVSVVAAYGFISPAASLPETMSVASVESQAEEEGAVRDYAAKGAEDSNAAAAPESAALFMMEGEAEPTAAPEMSSEAPAAGNADKISIPLYVTRETFDALTKLLVYNGTDFCLDEDYMVLPVTEENQSYIAEFAQEYSLGITPVPGETYDIQPEG